jgi:hemerythrin superfamily protein
MKDADIKEIMTIHYKHLLTGNIIERDKELYAKLKEIQAEHEAEKLQMVSILILSSTFSEFSGK